MSKTTDASRLAEVTVELDAFTSSPGRRMALTCLIDLIGERDRLMVRLGLTAKAGDGRWHGLYLGYAHVHTPREDAT